MKKELDTLLKNNHLAPRRELSETFTQSTVNRLNDRKVWSVKVKELFIMNILKRPAIALTAIVACMAIGGTSYAAVGGWNSIQAFFGGEKKGDNARIVTVNTNNCILTSALNITSRDKPQSTYYYRVINNSKLTNAEIIQIVKGYCENSSQPQSAFNVQAELNKNSLNQNTVVSGYIDSVVTAISASNIAIHSDIPIGNKIQAVDQTFPQIDPNVIIYSGSKRLAFSDIHVGDHISLSYRATGDALKNSETIQPNQVDTSSQVVVAISKNSPDLTAAVNYQKYNGKEFEQVTPCSNDASGFCNAEQYLSQKH